MSRDGQRVGSIWWLAGVDPTYKFEITLANDRDLKPRRMALAPRCVGLGDQPLPNLLVDQLATLWRPERPLGDVHLDNGCSD